jgi:hypothetical protein
VCLEDKPTWTRLSGMMLCPQKLRERYYSHRSGYVVLEHGRGPMRLLCWLKGHLWKVERQTESGYLDWLNDRCQRCRELRGIDY